MVDFNFRFPIFAMISLFFGINCLTGAAPPRPDVHESHIGSPHQLLLNGAGSTTVITTGGWIRLSPDGRVVETESWSHPPENIRYMAATLMRGGAPAIAAITCDYRNHAYDTGIYLKIGKGEFRKILSRRDDCFHKSVLRADDRGLLLLYSGGGFHRLRLDQNGNAIDKPVLLIRNFLMEDFASDKTGTWILYRRLNPLSGEKKYAAFVALVDNQANLLHRGEIVAPEIITEGGIGERPGELMVCLTMSFQHQIECRSLAKADLRLRAKKIYSFDKDNFPDRVRVNGIPRGWMLTYSLKYIAVSEALGIGIFRGRLYMALLNDDGHSSPGRLLADYNQVGNPNNLIRHYSAQVITGRILHVWELKTGKLGKQGFDADSVLRYRLTDIEPR